MLCDSRLQASYFYTAVFWQSMTNVVAMPAARGSTMISHLKLDDINHSAWCSLLQVYSAVIVGKLMKYAVG